MTFLLALTIIAHITSAQSDFQDVEKILKNIQLTEFNGDTINIVDLGAVGNGHFDNRQIITGAIEASSKAGGGVVVIPAGNFLSKGPINLQSNVNLHLLDGAVLSFSPEPADFLPAVFTRWEGIEIYNYSPMIYTNGQENIAITGKGIIDGNSSLKWVSFRDKQGTARSRVHNFSDTKETVKERVFGEGDYLRSSLIQFIDCKRILLEGVTLKNSPFWMFHPVYCSDIIVRNVSFNSLVINNDGIDFDSSSMGLVEGCTFTTGDDAVVFKSGRDGDGWRINKPTRNIVIRNCEAPKVLHGIAFGSEMSGGIENIFIENFKLGEVESQAIQFKANKDRGSYIRNVYIRNIEVDSAGSHLIYFTNNYHSYRGGNAPTEFHNIHIEDVRCNEANNVFQLQGLKEMPLHNIKLHNIKVKKANDVFSKKEHFKDVSLENVEIGGQNIKL